VNVDWDGLVVAFENRSQKITHFFDRDTGEVAQCVAEREPKRHAELSASRRYIALPKDRGERGRGEMELFLAEVGREKLREKLRAAMSEADPALAYREVLLSDPREEARFFQFKQRRARERAETWLASMGIPFERPPEPVKAPREFPGGAPGGPKGR
jgi:hypothetical protein